MGKASRWFRGLLGLKNADPDRNHPQRPPPKKKKWGFAVSQGEKDRRRATAPAGGGDEENDAGRHAVAVAAATAAVVEAAVAAAQAAAAVVRLTSSGRSISTAGGGGGGARREEWAAVTVQSHFRAYLSRRALRALKALVKLQALVRGHLVRKQTAYALRRLQALVRAQARARAGRVLNSESPQSSNKSSHFNYPGPPTPEKSERVIRTRSMKHNQLPLLKRNGSKSNSTITYDPEKPHTARIICLDSDKTDKILEVDNGNPKNCQTFSTSKDSTARQSVPSPSSGEAQSPSPLMFAQDVDESAFCTADNSPTYYSASSRGCSSRKSAFTPTKSDSSRSCFSNYSDHPNYMSYTESSKAKVRSLSAPKQRPHQIERSSSTKRYSIHGYGDLRSGQRVSALQANFTSKAYPGSGRLDRLGMPIRGDISGGYWHRY